MAVAATDNQDHRASFSGYGRWVDICAPGVNIWSTTGQSDFTFYAGTSFSTAMVSGLAALVSAWHPAYTNDQIESAIEQSADSVYNNNGLLGAGRINCASAVNIIISATSEESKIPDRFALSPNYPNPFNAQTIIRYDSPSPGQVTFNIYDILGRKIDEINSNVQEAGSHEIVWDARSFPSGLYFARIETGGKAQTIKMILLK
jgi:subtilisin family serine protease